MVYKGPDCPPMGVANNTSSLTTKRNTFLRDRVKKIALVAVIRSKHSLTFSLSIYGVANYTFHKIVKKIALVY